MKLGYCILDIIDAWNDGAERTLNLVAVSS